MIVDLTNSRNVIREGEALDIRIPVVLVRRTDGEVLHAGDLSRVDPAFIAAHEEACKAGEVQRASALVQQLDAMDSDALAPSRSWLTSLASRMKSAWSESRFSNLNRPRKSQTGICEHNRPRRRCRECRGSSICEHNRRSYECQECGGASICEHKRQ